MDPAGLTVEYGEVPCMGYQFPTPRAGQASFPLCLMQRDVHACRCSRLKSSVRLSIGSAQEQILSVVMSERGHYEASLKKFNCTVCSFGFPPVMFHYIKLKREAIEPLFLNFKIRKHNCENAKRHTVQQ